MYANPDRNLYDIFGMISNLRVTTKGEEKRSYLKRNLLSTTLWSIWVRQPCLYELTLQAVTFPRSVALLRVHHVLESKETFRSSEETLFSVPACVFSP